VAKSEFCVDGVDDDDINVVVVVVDNIGAKGESGATPATVAPLPALLQRSKNTGAVVRAPARSTAVADVVAEASIVGCGDSFLLFFGGEFSSNLPRAQRGGGEVGRGKAAIVTRVFTIRMIG